MRQQLINALTQIPDDIARLAHEQQLGTPQGSYTITKLSRRWLRFIPLAGFLFFLISLYAFIFAANAPSIFLFLSPFSWLIVGYFVLLSSLYSIRFVHKYCTTYPCDQGLILKQSATRFRVVRWDEIEAICSTSTRMATRLFLKSRLYTIHCHDGYTLTFSSLRSKRNTMHNLDKALIEQFTRRRLPFQFADYQAGRILSFGPLNINREGVSARGKMLPWEQIADISLLKDRRLVIYKTGERPEIWLNLPAFKIPNLSILLALFKRIRSGQREQEASFEALAAYGTTTTIVQSRNKLDTLPDGLSALAEEHKLGERRLDQNLGRSRLASWANIVTLAILDSILVTGVIIGGILNLPRFITNGYLADPVIFIELSVFFLMFIYIITRNLVRNLQQIHNDTYTFAHGMILKRGQQAPVLYHWEDIAIIWRVSTAVGITRHQQPTLPQLVSAHTLQLRNGDKRTLTRLNVNQEALGKIIKEQIVPLQMPAIVTAFQAGQTITFGTIQTNQQGITVGKRVLPWSQIKSVALQGRHLVIYDITQRKPWYRLSAEHIPNLFLLFGLADYAREMPTR